MGVFDEILGDWVQIVDDSNDKTIEDYSYDTGVIEGTTENHCVKCVAVNRCCFRNSIDKKPKRFFLPDSKLLDYILNGIPLGLYHFRCHCTELPITLPDLDDIQLIIPQGKIDWLFLDKSQWIEAMGYKCDIFFVEMLKDKIKQAYFYGNYELQEHTKFGIKVNLLIDIQGVNEKFGKNYKIKSSFMVFPYMKLKCNTLIGGWQK